jgi:hypothetical protein
VVRTGPGRENIDLRQVSRDGKTVYLANGKEIDEDAFEAQMDALDARLEAMDEDLQAKFANLPFMSDKQIRVIERNAARADRDAERAGRQAEREAARAEAAAPEIRNECADGSDRTTTVNRGGKRIVYICKKRIMASALAGMRSARARVASDPSIPAAARAEALASLDGEIARVQAEQ